MLGVIWGGGAVVLLALAALFVVVLNSQDEPDRSTADAQKKTKASAETPEPDKEKDSGSPREPAPDDKASMPSADTSSDPAEGGAPASGEAAPSAAGDASPSPGSAADGEKPPGESAPPKSAGEKLLAAVTAWRDAAAVRGVQKGDLQLEIDTVWSGPDPGYRPDWLAAPGAEEDPVFDISEVKGTKGAPPESPLRGAKVGPLKYFFVRMFVKNVGDSPVRYLSWNGVEGKPETAAVVSDSEGRLARLVPLSEAPAADRLSHAQIGPGEEISDILVFEKLSEKNASLRLVLPYAAVGMTGQVGFELPGQMLGEMPADSVLADTSSAPAGGAGASAAASGAAAASPSAAGPTAASDGQPLSFDALRKAVEGSKPAADKNAAGEEAAKDPPAEGEPGSTDKPAEKPTDKPTEKP